MKIFDNETAKEYDLDIREKIPGYDLMQELIQTIISLELPSNSKILVSGCGTGEEIKRINDLNLGYSLVGIDPSPAMLEIAQKKTKADYHTSTLEEYETRETFDAVLSILVSHFMPDTGAKDVYFKKVSTLLKPGGLLINVDFMESSCLRFLSPSFGQKIGKAFFPISESRMEDILGQEFEQPDYFFNSFGFKGYLARRAMLS